MKTLIKILPYIAIIILIYLLFKNCNDDKEVIEVEKKIEYTQKQIESIKATIEPIKIKVVEFKEIYRTIKEKEPLIVYDTIICKEIVSNLKQQIKNCDSIVANQEKIISLKDTIETKYIKIIEFKDVLIDKKQKKFGIGIQSGVDYKGKPYFGVGISYNLFNL